MIFPQFVIFVLIYDYLKFRKDSFFLSQEITNCISVTLAVALSVHTVMIYERCYLSWEIFSITDYKMFLTEK